MSQRATAARTAAPRYTLLCTDVDGTLLDRHGEITPANRVAVSAAVAAGKKIVLCSGRTWHSLKLYEEALGLHTAGQFGIGFNGGAVYEVTADETSPIRLHYSRLMPAATAQGIFTALRPVIAQYPEINMLAYNCEGYLIAEESLKSSRLFDEMIKLGARVVPSYEQENGDMYKILLHGKHEELREVEKFAAQAFAGKCQIMFSAHSLMELIPVGVDKGRGVEFLAEHLGIHIEEVIAVGDEENDIAMLRAAGLGIAVANAVPDAVAAADVHLTVSNDDSAVAHVIEKYFEFRTVT